MARLYNDSAFLYNASNLSYDGVATLSFTAIGSGVGSGTATGGIVQGRSAAGSGIGSSTVVYLVVRIRTATGSGVGTSSATRVVGFVRTGDTSVGAGSSTVTRVITKLRTATASGLGTSSSIVLHVVIRTSTGTGNGISSGAAYVSRLRTASGAGTGTQVSSSTRGLRRACIGSGASQSTVTWDKSHIFRVPYTYQYANGFFNDTNGTNRLSHYIKKDNVRARNLYKLIDNSYTVVDQRDPTQVKKLWHGGRDHFLTPEEIEELTLDGFGASIT